MTIHNGTAQVVADKYRKISSYDGFFLVNAEGEIMPFRRKIGKEEIL